MHLSDGEIRSYQDRELTQKANQRVKQHLDECLRCQERHQSLLNAAQRTRERVASLDPGSQQGHIQSGESIIRLNNSIQKKEAKTMWKKFGSKKMRPIWIGLGLVILIIVSMTVAPVRAIANNLLGLFRVEQFAVVEVNPELLWEQFGSSTQFEQIITQRIQVEENGQPVEVSTREEAQELVNFDVRLPAGMNAQSSELVVNPAGRATFIVDTTILQAVLEEIGRSDITVPAGVNGATVKLYLKEGVSAAYGDCEPDPTSYDEGGNADYAIMPRLSNCTLFWQIPSPSIEAPPGLNLEQIGTAYLQLLGMSQQEAETFARNVDWTSTFIIPIPMNGTSYEEFPVDGVTGILIQQAFEDGEQQYVLMWVKDGIVYLLAGPGGPTTAASIARSLR